MAEKLNIFHIPSWYPSGNAATPGYFIREQVQLLAARYPNQQHFLSLWGQNDARYLLPIHEPLKNLAKVLHHKKLAPQVKELSENLCEIHTPAFTWTRKLAKGNIEGIIQANLRNLEKAKQISTKIHLIHAHISYPAGYIAYRISKETGIPYLIAEHMGPFPFDALKKKNGEPIEELQLALRHARKVLAPSQFLAKQIQAYSGAVVDVIPNFIDFQAYPLQTSERKVFKIAYLGRLEPSKGLWLLMDALKLLKNTPWECEIAGEGSLERPLKYWIHEHGLSDRIKVIGFLADHRAKVDFLTRCDTLVLPSYHENFGIVLIEAMACGKPVVSTHSGGPAEIIHDGNGILTEMNSPRALASGITHIMETYHTYKPALIREHAKSSYDAEVAGGKLMSLYASSISPSG